MRFNFKAGARCILLRHLRRVQVGLADMIHNASAKRISQHINNGSYTIAANVRNKQIKEWNHWIFEVTNRIQSTAKMRETSSGGSPTVSSTITSVTRPACGIPAAPILAAVDVMLENTGQKAYSQIRLSLTREHCLLDRIIMNWKFMYELSETFGHTWLRLLCLATMGYHVAEQWI